MFEEAEGLQVAPRRWVLRHLQRLDLFKAGAAEKLRAEATNLLVESAEFVDQGPYIR